MKKIPPDIIVPFNNLLTKKAIPEKYHPHYKKWLRYYLDFCSKYNHHFKNNESLPFFIKKLQEKNQLLFQQEQAAQAISLFYEITHGNIKETGSTLICGVKSCIAMLN